MTFIGKTLAMAHQEVIPFTPSTYDDAHPIATWGGTVNVDTAMTLPTAYACTRAICEDIGKLPLHIFKARPGGAGRDFDPDHEWYDALHDQANEFQTAIEAREMLTAFALNRGRGIAEKQQRRVRLPGGQTILRREIAPLHPDLVVRRLTDRGAIIYEYTDPKTGNLRTFLPDELLIIRGFISVGVITFARRTFEAMLAQQGLATQTWRRGPRHSGVITRPKDAPKWNSENRGVFRENLEQYEAGGEHEGRPLLLEDGMTWENASFSLADSQFVENQMLSDQATCQLYRVPQHKVQILTRATNNNIEQQSRDYNSDSLLSWAVRWEQVYQRDLLEKPWFAKHNMDATIRGDTKERAESHVLYVNAGIKTQDEIRALEDLNPMGGSAAELRQALNMGGNPATTDADTQAEEEEDEPTPIRRKRARASEGDDVVRTALMSKVRAFSQDAAGRVFNRERSTLAKLAERTSGGKDWLDGVDAFYTEFSAFVARAMRTTPEAAEAYCADRRALAWAQGPTALEDPDENPIGALVELAVNPTLVLQLSTGATA